MGLKSKVVKRKWSIAETTSSSGENTGSGDERPLSPLQDVKYSGTAMVVLHIFYDSNIELVRESNVAAVVGDELEGRLLSPHKYKQDLEGSGVIEQA